MPIFLCEIHGRNAMLVVHNSFNYLFLQKLQLGFAFYPRFMINWFNINRSWLFS